MKAFFIILATFVLAFGIAIKAILFPSAAFSIKLFIDIFNTAYWPIYGDMSVLETIKNEDCNETKSCPTSISRYSSYVLLMIYVIIANILLVNLLIAMFRFEFKS